MGMMWTSTGCLWCRSAQAALAATRARRFIRLASDFIAVQSNRTSGARRSGAAIDDGVDVHARPHRREDDDVPRAHAMAVELLTAHEVEQRGDGGHRAVAEARDGHRHDALGDGAVAVGLEQPL